MASIAQKNTYHVDRRIQDAAPKEYTWQIDGVPEHSLKLGSSEFDIPTIANNLLIILV